MRLFVTGANGFLGRAVVDAALVAGHEVLAMVRDTNRWAGPTGPGVELVQGDLRDPASWRDRVTDVDVVVHLAATKAGDLHTQFAGTVVGTERLLDVLDATPPTRLVHISTFSVYDYEAAPAGSQLDERSPLEDEPATRDEYAQTKLVQERLVRERSAEASWELVVLRPGAVWGPGELWDGGGLMGLGSARTLVVAPNAALKLTYVTNCAEAIVAAADAPAAAGATIDIVDDDPPSARQFAQALRQAGLPVRQAVAVPYGVMHGAATLLDRVNRRFVGGNAKLPGIIMPAKLAARAKPLTYPNARAKELLGWQPRLGLRAAIEACAEAERSTLGYRQ